MDMWAAEHGGAALLICLQIWKAGGIPEPGSSSRTQAPRMPFKPSDMPGVKIVVGLHQKEVADLVKNLSELDL